ncbi:MAG: putative aminodeoxychorismate lyase [Microgenomates group bacterium ADurb.Bin238]|nr:MAG: putative aminodeoxychorismate lyase [Microgenomates group bacterium ADurb.Bin238]
MTRRRSAPLKPLFILLSLIVLLFLLLLTWFKLASRPVNPYSTKRVNFTIEKGQGLDSIGQTLYHAGLIRSIPAFRLQVMISNLSTKIQAGDFAIPPTLTLAEVAQSLTVGTSDRWVTLLEGWRREEIAQALVDTLSPSNPEYDFDPDTFILMTKDLEGQLYPDTYSFTRSTTAQAAIDRLTTRFKEQTEKLSNQSGLTDKQALVLASLIEREAFTDQERPIIAGILLNRFHANWPLQVDATVQYVKANLNCQVLTCNWWPNDLTKDDLNLPSPYNTYSQPGLPPLPITNPSLESIKAAYQPSTTPYWFYLHDPSGQIHYAKTLEEHNLNIAKYLK